MALPAPERPPKDFRELQWQQAQGTDRWREKGICAESGAASKNRAGAKTITLPYYSAGSGNVSRYVEINTDSGHGNTLGKMRIKKANPIIPGWLIELKEFYLRGVMDLKTILEENDGNVQSVVGELCKVMNYDMKMTIKDKDIYEILKKIPKNCDGNYSFPHFMFAMGNPEMAQAKGIFLINERSFGEALDRQYAKGSTNCCWGDEEDGDGCEEDESAGDRKRGSMEVLNSAGGEEEEEVEEEEEGEGGSAGAAGGKSKKTDLSSKPDETGYSLREKLFFSGLLIFEMYDTLKKVEKLYNSSKIPELADKEREKNKRRGYGQDTIGSKKMKEAAWDKPLPPIPKLSPYLSAVPFVTTRWNTSTPGPHESVKRTFSKLQPLYLAIRPPKNIRQPICITENQNRVRLALAYLASKGDCVACLPDIHFVIHLSDTAVNKLEVIIVREPIEGCPYKTRSKQIEAAAMLMDARTLFNPYALPRQITNLSNRITFTDGLQLRDICAHLQKQHWSNVSQNKLDFRERIWKEMHVDEVPLGGLRDSFIYSFVTYLPYVSHLPIAPRNQNHF